MLRRFLGSRKKKLIKKLRSGFALALGGGGARGLAHIGVLSALEELSLKPSLVVGTSMGAIVGAAYCSGVYPSAGDMLDAFKGLVDSDLAREFGIEEIYRKSLSLRSIYARLSAIYRILQDGFIYPASLLREVVARLIPDISIRDCAIPFLSVTLDIKSGERYVFEEGSLVDAVVASASIPGIFEPFIHDVSVLVDGGWIENVPYPTAREKGYRRVIAVDVSAPLDEENLDIENGISVVLRADSCALKKLQKLQTEEAELLLKPDIPPEVRWYHFWRIDELFTVGRACALSFLVGNF